MWLKSLKIAIVEQNIELLDKLLSQIPHFNTKEELEQAICLLEEATNMMHLLREETRQTMIQLKKNLDFLRTTDIPTSKSLDIKY